MIRKTGKGSENIQVDLSDLRDLRKLVAGGESLRLEFKAKANHPDKIARSLCSFCNAGGGTLLLGVNDDGLISGVRYPDEDIHAILKILRTARPFVKFRVSIIPVTEKRSVVRFDIAEGRRKPVTLRMDKGKVFVRSDDECLQAGPVLKAVLKLQTAVQGSMIRFDEEEKLILKLFNDYTTKTFSQILHSVRLPEADVQDRLSLLVTAGVLRLIPGDQQESFCLNGG